MELTQSDDGMKTALMTMRGTRRRWTCRDEMECEDEEEEEESENKGRRGNVLLRRSMVMANFFLTLRSVYFFIRCRKKNLYVIHSSVLLIRRWLDKDAFQKRNALVSTSTRREVILRKAMKAMRRRKCPFGICILVSFCLFIVLWRRVCSLSNFVIFRPFFFLLVIIFLFFGFIFSANKFLTSRVKVMKNG